MDLALFSAIASAIAAVGSFLAAFFTLRLAERSKHVRVRVDLVQDNSDPRRPRLGIKAVNLSEFAVSILEVGWERDTCDPDRRSFHWHAAAKRDLKMPRRLDHREAHPFYFGAELTDEIRSRVVCGFVLTDCGHRFTSIPRRLAARNALFRLMRWCASRPKPFRRLEQVPTTGGILFRGERPLRSTHETPGQLRQYVQREPPKA